MKLYLFFFSIGLLLIASSSKSQSWSNEFVPGQYDSNGKYLGGTEVMSLTPHKGKLYAATSYVCDKYYATYDLAGGTPILVLDSANAEWKQDVLFTDNLLIPSLKEIIFTKDYQGNTIQPDTLLITGPNNKKDHIFIYVKDDATGNWIKDSVTTVAGNVEIRSIGTHFDAVTGHQFIFIGVSDFGIWKGEYNASLPSKIQWNPEPEFAISLSTRVPSITDVNGKIYIGTTETNTWISRILRRVDGVVPSWEQVWTDTASDELDLRGFTAVKNPTGSGDDLWFYWNDYFRRLQPQNNDSIIEEFNVSSDLSMETGRVFSGHIIGGYNDHQVFWKDPVSKDTLMLIGLQAMYDSVWLLSNPHPNINRRTIDGMYYSRKQQGSTISYQLHYIVNNTPVVIDTLLAVRTICISPFAADSNNVLYAGGYHTNHVFLSNTAWVYRGNFANIATSVNETSRVVHSIYPNPANQSFTIDLNAQAFDVIVCDVEGKNLYEAKNLSGTAEIDCRNFHSGIYFVHITTKDQLFYNEKIIVTNF